MRVLGFFWMIWLDVRLFFLGDLALHQQISGILPTQMVINEDLAKKNVDKMGV